MFGPQLRLDLARRLAAAKDEASHRAAIHQAYYAVFHRCCAGIGRNPSDRAEAGHARLRDDLFRRSGNEPWLRAAKVHINTLLALRAWADYDDQRPITDEQAADAVRRAVQVVG